MVMLKYVAIALLAVASPALAASPFNGTFRTDPTTMELPDKPRELVLAGGVYACTSCAPPERVPADGAAHALPGHPYADQMSVKVIDPRTIAVAYRKGGRATYEYTQTVAADGKTAVTAWTEHGLGDSAPVTGTETGERVAPPAAGAHVVSGAWRTTTMSASENGLVFTMADDGRAFSFADQAGSYSYTAPFGGAAVPVKGDPTGGMVAATKRDDRTIELAITRGGKPAASYTMVAAPDGRTITAVYEDKLQNTQTRMVMNKQ